MSILKNINKFSLSAVVAATIAMPVTAHYEGVKTKSYLDPVGIATICYGETSGVELGQTKTLEECEEILAFRLGYFSYLVEQLLTESIPPETHAAFASFSYNVGIENFKSSTLLKKANAGDIIGACNELPRWVYAGGKKFKGLVRRREAEKELCLSGVV